MLTHKLLCSHSVLDHLNGKSLTMLTHKHRVGSSQSHLFLQDG